MEEGATGGNGLAARPIGGRRAAPATPIAPRRYACYPHRRRYFGQLPLFLFITFVTGREILRTRATTRGECVATLRTNERRVYPTDIAVPHYLSLSLFLPSPDVNRSGLKRISYFCHLHLRLVVCTIVLTFTWSDYLVAQLA